jgi:hypothetical protein
MPEINLDDVHASHVRPVSTLSGLTDTTARRPSLLRLDGRPWGHLARNADSHLRLDLGYVPGDRPTRASTSSRPRPSLDCRRAISHDRPWMA